MKLPAAGRTGPAPKFPIVGLPTPATWDELWATPQAVQWEKQGIVRVIARYAVILERAEMIDTTAAMLNEVRQMEDRLGLTPMAMVRMKWQIEDPEAEVKQVKVPAAERKRAQLKIVG